MNVFIFEIKRQLKPLLAWSTIVALLLVLFMAFFPSMASSGMAQLVKAKINAIPPGMREVVGISQMTDFSDLLQYFAYVAQYILMAACIYAGILGASALVKEETEGTIEFLYAQPISRSKITSIKLLSILSVLGAFNVVFFLVSLILFQAFKEPGYVYLNLLWAMFQGMIAAQLVFLALGLSLSSVLPRSSQPATVALAVFFITYLLGTFSLVIKKLEWLKYLSPFHYVQPSTILSSGGTIKPVFVVLMLSVIIIAIFFAYWRYSKKDFLL